MRIPGSRAVLLCGLVLTGMTLSGCVVVKGGSSPATVTATPSVTTPGTTTPSPAASTPTEEPTTAVPSPTGPVDFTDRAAVAKAFGVRLVDPKQAGMDEGGIYGFSSPSKRIRCGIQPQDSTTDANVRCDVTEVAWKDVPAKPADCEFDWGSAVYVVDGKGQAGFACVSDAAANATTVLPYGQGVLVGPVLCVSRTVGMECVVLGRVRHGFRVSRAAFTLY